MSSNIHYSFGIYRHRGSWAIVLLKSKWVSNGVETKARKCKKRDQWIDKEREEQQAFSGLSCLLTNEWIIECSRLCISLIRARLGPWKDRKTGVRSFFLSVLSFNLLSSPLSTAKILITSDNKLHTYTLTQMDTIPYTVILTAETICCPFRQYTLHNWPRGQWQEHRAQWERTEQKSRTHGFCFRNWAWAAKICLVGSANYIIWGWDVPEEDMIKCCSKYRVKPVVETWRN